MINDHVYSRLTTHAPLFSLVSNGVYPVKMPQGELGQPPVVPCVVYRTGTVMRQKRFCGTDELVLQAFDFDCYATKYDVASSVADAVESALIDYSGLLSYTYVVSTIYAGRMDLDDPSGLYRVTVSFDIWHRPGA